VIIIGYIDALEAITFILSMYFYFSLILFYSPNPSLSPLELFFGVVLLFLLVISLSNTINIVGTFLFFLA
jgi:hypothetical protein